MEFSPSVSVVINRAFIKTGKERHEYVTPEHFLYALCSNEAFIETMEEMDGDVEALEAQLEDFFQNVLTRLDPEDLPDPEEGQDLQLSKGMDYIFNYGLRQALASGKNQVTLSHMLRGMLNLKESHALYYLSQAVEDLTEFFSLFQEHEAGIKEEEELPQEFGIEIMTEPAGGSDMTSGHATEEPEEAEVPSRKKKDKNQKNAQYLTCLNDQVQTHNPLVGREEILERTMQVLCCRDKNNPLHIGEAGVGKTSLAYGLAALINQDKVPPLLKEAKVFELDLGGLVAGTQYRGEFEKRLKGVMDLLLQENFPILYIDEIHRIMGAGDMNGGMDAAGLLKPYFDHPDIRFMGSTTYEEYKKTISRNAGLLRRFETIDVDEPDRDQCVAILSGISDRYEEHHQVVYEEDFLQAAVDLSTRYLHERFLPDKAITVMDEAGAWLQLHPEAATAKTHSGLPIATKELAEQTIARMCRIPAEEVNEEETVNLRTLQSRMNTQIFGQDEALSQLSYAVSISRLGLTEGNKPVASLLFVGPTGVGKTETAKVLAKELGVALVRFDMSEYTEKHTVAKLIGSPAGYVGYEEGGLLTEAVRKTPHCVLLLDEIEKAHSDIYNVLLQVMDYATLTDNHGKKTDFSHVVLIMTSNAGIAKARQVMGFGDNAVADQDVMDEVKHVFSPEFRNRLSQIVMFHKLTKEMALRIVDKNLNALKQRLFARKLQLSWTDQAREQLLQEGFSEEYGARELERVIQNRLNPMLVNLMLTENVAEDSCMQISVDENAALSVEILTNGVSD